MSDSLETRVRAAVAAACEEVGWPEMARYLRSFGGADDQRRFDAVLSKHLTPLLRDPPPLRECLIAIADNEAYEYCKHHDVRGLCNMTSWESVVTLAARHALALADAVEAAHDTTGYQVAAGWRDKCRAAEEERDALREDRDAIATALERERLASRPDTLGEICKRLDRLNASDSEPDAWSVEIHANRAFVWRVEAGADPQESGGVLTALDAELSRRQRPTREEALALFQRIVNGEDYYGADARRALETLKGETK